MKKKRQIVFSGEDANNWKTTSDILTALLLIVLLLAMLLILYIIQRPEEHIDDTWGGHSYDDFEYHDWDENDHERDHDKEHDRDEDERDHNNGGGGGGGYDPEPPVTSYPYPEGQDYSKAAVYVVIVDAETHRVIKEAGVQFQLLNSRREVQTLNTYYPVKISYKIFETTDQGDFYLPEKINLGNYILRELTEPYGYDGSEPIYFDVDEPYDWPTPLKVEVPMFPSRNIIRLQVNDRTTGEGVGGGVYNVVAAEDIITADGTLRYESGSVVGQITLNSAGYGESKELYLGNYRLEQSVIPRYYIGDEEPLEIELKKKTNNDPIETITCEKTVYSGSVVDELYTDQGISGAEFLLSGADMRTLISDPSGRFTVTDLDKNITYTITQISTSSGYRMADEDIVFSVDSKGNIVETEPGGRIYNRIIRVRIGIRDTVLRNYISDYTVALMDEQGEIVRRWDSTGMAQELNGIDPGSYQLVVGSNRKVEVLNIENDKNIQTFNCLLWTSQDIWMTAGGSIALVALLIIVVVVIKKKASGKNKDGGTDE